MGVFYLKFTEIDPVYYLQPEKFRFSDCLDPIRIDNLSVLRHDFLSKASGYNSIQTINGHNLEMRNYKY